MDKKRPLTFEDVKNDDSLRKNVQSAIWSDTGKLSDIGDDIENTNQELHDLLRKIGLTVVDGERPDVMEVIRASKLKETVERLHLQREMILDQMRAAIREELSRMLPLETLNEVPIRYINDFYDDLIAKTHSRMGFSRLISLGKEILHQEKENNDE